MPTITFSPEKSEAQQAIVVSFDLSGFSEFCNRQDTHVILPKFLSKLFDELNASILDLIEWFFTEGNSTRKKLTEPTMIKFTGDGAIMIWTTDPARPFTDSFRSDLVAIMRQLQERISLAIPRWEKELLTTGLPEKARFGIAIGYVYGLRPQNSLAFSDPTDYVGNCINLAVRLQNHCPEIGFVVHQNLHPTTQGMVEFQCVGIKGMQNERVRVFQADLNRIDQKDLETKFRVLG